MEGSCGYDHPMHACRAGDINSKDVPDIPAIPCPYYNNHSNLMTLTVIVVGGK
jgi:hypothetical protein